MLALLSVSGEDPICGQHGVKHSGRAFFCFFCFSSHIYSTPVCLLLDPAINLPLLCMISALLIRKETPL